MKDHLEDFVSQHRDLFDDKEPNEGLWARIEGVIFSKRRSLWDSVVLWRAAAVVFMTLSLYLLIPRLQSQQQNSIALKEFNDVEAFYVQQISNKVDMIDDFADSEGLNGFTHDFQQLEAMYLVLKEEMKVHPSKKVRDALVLNLLVRIDLLNQQLHKLEQSESGQGAVMGRS